MTSAHGGGERRLGWFALGALIVAWLVLPLFAAVVAFGVDDLDGGYRTVRTTIVSVVFVDVCAILILALVIQRLKWWRRVLCEDMPTRRWVVAVPIAYLVYCLAVTDYAHLSAARTTQVLAFALAMLAIGLSEELLFRGVALVAMRDRYREGWAVFWSCLLFGALHLVNVITVGGGAAGQAVMSFGAGYFLYLCRRVGRGLWLPVLVHAAIDFAVFSNQIGYDQQQSSDAAFYEFLLMAGLAILLLVRRKSISPAGAGAPTTATPG